jgi:hypothetical protein
MLTNQDIKKIDGLFSKRIGEELAPIKKDIVKIRKDQNTIVNFFDKEYLDLRERVEVIERRLSIGI